jgi:serine/threonine-protein kinase
MHRVGEVLAGRYELRRFLGGGGGGEVYEAWDSRLERAVAIKLLVRAEAADRKRFAREARAAAALQHRNVVAAFDAAVNDDPYLVMELLSGRTLADEISEGALSPRRARDVGTDLLAGLAAVHAAGLLHRDVKPSNVLVDGDGSVKLTDFGIVRTDASTMTRPGQVLGSLPFIAPEVLRGESSSTSSDIYAVGVTLDAALRGRPVFARDTPAETIAAVLDGAVPGPAQPGAPRSLTDLVARAMDPDPERRPPDADAMRDQLVAVHAGGGARKPAAVAAAASAGAVTAVGATETMRAIARTQSAAEVTASAPAATEPTPPPDEAEQAEEAQQRRNRAVLVGLAAAAVLILALGARSILDDDSPRGAERARTESTTATTSPPTTVAPTTALPVAPPAGDDEEGSNGRGHDNGRGNEEENGRGKGPKDD